MRKLVNKKGFTLIELMIVVVIIGILAALAIPRFMQASKKAKISEAKSVVKQIYEMGLAYYEEHGGWPTSSTPGYPSSGYLNNGWSQVGIDAPSGKPRFCYTWENDDSDASGSDVIGKAQGSEISGCPNQYADASLAGIEVTVTADGVINVTMP